MVSWRLIVINLPLMLAFFPAIARSADELPLQAGWRRTSEIAAPEAVQAAAADERFGYAVNNTVIAKYDRESGRRLAVSVGEARHLNSGFLWKGKIYCAHSNYPAVPEKSEIKVLDPETMQLTTHHDFGNYGGSLTWCIRRDGFWWCNFARYGDDNSRTFLVRFDDAWKEQARWTYPHAVVRELGRYSLSGGVWDGDHLIVTGHDDPVVFELRLPESGSVLDLIARRRVPFIGQGIAADPAAGGLVGIDRGKKKIVFAVRESD